MTVVYCADEEGMYRMEILLALNVSGEEMSEEDMRKELRLSIKETMRCTHVWFEDECGSRFDPVHGPFPVYGPKAQALRN